MNQPRKYRLGILVTHPIQYYVPWYQNLATHPGIILTVYYCYQQTAQGQAAAGFGVAFDWDIPLLQGYNYQFLVNQSSNPNVFDFWGCDTPEITDIIKLGKFDAFIVHGWYTKSYWQAILACWQSQTPLFVRGDSHLLTERSSLKVWLKYRFYRWFIPKFTRYLAVGRRAEEYYLYYGAQATKIVFCPHAVDNQFFASHALALSGERGKIRQDWGIPENALVFLFVGKFIPKKRPGDFLGAIALASQKSAHIWGLMVGDGELCPEMVTTAQSQQLNITFVGFLNQTQLPRAYTAADVLVLPSDGGETWGLVVNEAMASGLPAIVSDRVGCSPDLVIPGKTGEIFPCGDVAALAQILQRFAAHPGDVATMGNAAKSLIAHYSISQAVAGTVTAVKSLVSS
ncbi:glycosyltransferase family 4 protein [Cylindrospermopsis raciborskii CS-506_D]|uniref:Glycosyltransferase family 4 protein n=1 Tax=Cylindrospermopsis raciborskii CS-506_A TaxID=2585140 RepID=A0A838WLB1_9CYAN|nr:glycosyltransferase family 4 protein [Cylindrospermopsis raciborskii]MBA4445338.1 glycosyltransferase family 4 protein [Cylindrospermopsis raciborskii CS-506_C]MBA4449578.1 glycosyltransferase family 4 protein [Cylindrospermopsis raciborskii CS-506_D]MBA4456199.1 glycosyltransferase family 4 protein [Cylindrospermopsis raciborskii CS-506_B]MBA4465545.1 glycosyltransferase family 4 protein [Cylindrospermopsis raciborskii CS-506_A]OHY41061.1 hypothetical protein BCV63_11085 [Cylindrospermopsi